MPAAVVLAAVLLAVLLELRDVLLELRAIRSNRALVAGLDVGAQLLTILT